MMYNQKFVACVKSGGKVLRETGETIYLNFGAEYSLLLKNLSSRSASVTVEIDGQDVLGGRALIVRGNSEVELERFLENMDKGRRFKFIERTEEIENHKGIGAADGLIRVGFTFEREKVEIPQIKYRDITIDRYRYRDNWDCDRWYTTCDAVSPYYDKLMNCSTTLTNTQGESYTSGSLIGAKMDSGLTRGLNNLSFNASEATACAAAPVNDAGITVKGSESHQAFSYGYLGELETTEHTIILQLKGKVGEKVVSKPITVQQRKVCPSCGRSYKFTHEYCIKDGTFLEIETK